MSYGEREKKLQELGYTGKERIEKIIRKGITEQVLMYESEKYYYKGNLPF